MKPDYIAFQERSVPLAYLITIRTYGTWLHGDERGSMDRREYNRYGDPKIAENTRMKAGERKLMKSPALLLDARARAVVEEAVREVCRFRGYLLYAANARTNHIHVVVSASDKPEKAMNSFKAYATRSLRERGLITDSARVWARHGSTRYLWAEKHIGAAADYVKFDQGSDLPAFD